jgi:ribonuclease BN (tRNA processing enzyme)
VKTIAADRVIILGSGSPIPYSDRAQSGTLLEAGPILVDCGSGILSRFNRMDIGAVNDIFLTHHHLDHMSDLLPILKARWLMGHTETNVYGPKGTEGLLAELLDLHAYLGEHIRINIIELKSGDVMKIRGTKVETLETVHLVPSLAYKFTNKVVISGDTEPFPGMRQFADGCALLIHECSFPDGFDVPGHSTPSRLGEALAGCRVKTLVLTHLYPPAIAKGEEMVGSLRGAGFRGRVVLVEDLACFETS